MAVVKLGKNNPNQGRRSPAVVIERHSGDPLDRNPGDQENAADLLLRGNAGARNHLESGDPLQLDRRNQADIELTVPKSVRDLCWGMVLAASVSCVGYLAGRWLGVP